MATEKLGYRKRTLQSGCGLIIIITGFLLYLAYTRPTSIEIMSVRKIKYKNENSDQKVILYWTPFFTWKDYEVGFGKQPFVDCPQLNCITTNNRSFLNQSDAIIFHIRDFKFDDLPSHRLPHQRWIFFLNESPHHTPPILDRLNNTFNWTMTHRLDSDIPYPYSFTTNEMNNKRIVTETKEKEAGEFDRRLTDLISKKNKTIAWVVSHCQPPSERQKYVNVLRKYISVTMYGGCNNNPCPRDNCFETLGKQYKFYLSFENSLCRDYVTEKFYDPLLNNMVPIVYGSANYSRIPELSSAYIDTRNFISVEALANYLHYLDKNDAAYQKYFEWRRKPAGLSILPRQKKAWCNLCQMLSQPLSPNSFSSHQDLPTWWNDQAKCNQDKKIFDDQIKHSQKINV